MTTISKDEFIERLLEGLQKRVEKFSRHLDIQGHGDAELTQDEWLRTFEAWSSQSSPERDLAMEIQAYLKDLPMTAIDLSTNGESE